jgi:hypothetical protein
LPDISYPAHPTGIIFTPTHFFLLTCLLCFRHVSCFRRRR